MGVSLGFEENYGSRIIEQKEGVPQRFLIPKELDFARVFGYIVNGKKLTGRRDVTDVASAP